MMHRLCKYLLALFLGYTQVASSQDRQLHMWSENFRSEANIAIITLALEKAAPRFGNIHLQKAESPSYEDAFNRLDQNKSGFDVVISGLNDKREKNAIPVYFPLDRGLLGFRICIISNSAHDNFARISKNADFARFSLQTTLDAAWPDATIMRYNKIPILPAATHQQRLDLARKSDSICYSRSILEITSEVANNPTLSIEKSFVMIYPGADILYFRKGAKQLAEAVEYGLEQAFQDGSFIREFNRFHADTNSRLSLYDRKLLIMPSPVLSEKGRAAINRYGIFSFVKQPVNSDA